MTARSLTVRLEGELFELPAECVLEVLPRIEPVLLPGLPVHVPGMLRYRGRWLPLVDPGPPLGLPPADRPRAVVLRRGRIAYALAIDAVGGIRDERESHDELVTPLDPDTLFAAQLAAAEEPLAMADSLTRALPLAAVLFRLGRHDLGLDIAGVAEVLAWQEPTPVPRAPAFVRGVLDLRGAVLPVVDLRERLGVPPSPADAETRILVVALAGERIGLVVDQVTQVVRILPEAVSRPPRYFRGLAAELIRGLARVGDRLVVLLEIERILDSDERLQLLEADLGAERPDDPPAPGSVPTPPGGRRRARGAP